jgi:hypothetical protein
MTYDLQYLGRQLNERARRAAEEFGTEVVNMLATAGVNGVNSSRTYLRFSAAGLTIVEREVNIAIQFAYNYTGEHDGEVFNQVSYCAKQMVDKIVGIVRARNSPVGGDIINKMEVSLRERKDMILDNFRHGMMGSERLKNDGVISVVQNNSPGAVLQVGSGNFNQSAYNQSHQSLVQEIEKALASPEFSALTPDDKVSVKDIADVVKEEAKKPEPEPGKLKRWGNRLVKITEDVGLKVVSGTIAGILLKMYTGG